MTETELAAFNAGGHKGSFDWTDYNRLGASIQELAEILEDLGYAINATARSDWTKEEPPTASDRAALLADLNKLKTAMSGTRPLPASWEYLDYEDANNAEMLLKQIEINIYLMMSSFLLCGEIYSGEF